MLCKGKKVRDDTCAANYSSTCMSSFPLVFPRVRNAINREKAGSSYSMYLYGFDHLGDVKIKLVTSILKKGGYDANEADWGCFVLTADKSGEYFCL